MIKCGVCCNVFNPTRSIYSVPRLSEDIFRVLIFRRRIKEGMTQTRPVWLKHGASFPPLALPSLGRDLGRQGNELARARDPLNSESATGQLHETHGTLYSEGKTLAFQFYTVLLCSDLFQSSRVFRSNDGQLDIGAKQIDVRSSFSEDERVALSA